MTCRGCREDVEDLVTCSNCKQEVCESCLEEHFDGQSGWTCEPHVREPPEQEEQR